MLDELQWDFFLAHAADDREKAKELYDLLSPQFRVFLDSVSVAPGGWDLVIPRAQRASLVTVVLISSIYPKAHYLRDEIAIAIGLSRADQRHVVIPVYLEDPSLLTEPVPYGLNIIKSFAVSRDGGMIGVAQKLGGFLRNDYADGMATPPLDNPKHPLSEFPTGPHVPAYLTRMISEAYARAIAANRASEVVDDAIALRVEADPGDPDVTLISHSELPTPEVVGASLYWRQAFVQAGLHGPRMLAALLMAQDETRFPQTVRQNRQQLLERLKTWTGE